MPQTFPELTLGGEEIDSVNPGRPLLPLLVASAAIGAGISGEAEAQIVSITTPVTLNNTNNTWYLNGTGGTALASIRIDSNPFFGGGGASRIEFPANNNFNHFSLAGTAPKTVNAFALGAHINAGAFAAGFNPTSISFSHKTNGHTAGSFWHKLTIGTPTYIGFSFNSGAGVEYGWAQITLEPNLAGITIDDWAYQTAANTDITVGDTGMSAVPEPADYALIVGTLAAGVAGMRAYKKRRQELAA